MFEVFVKPFRLKSKQLHCGEHTYIFFTLITTLRNIKSKNGGKYLSASHFSHIHPNKSFNHEKTYSAVALPQSKGSQQKQQSDARAAVVCRIKWELKVEFTQGLSLEYLIIFKFSTRPIKVIHISGT